MNTTQNTSNESPAALATRALVQQTAEQFGYASAVPAEGLSTANYIERLLFAMKQGGTVPTNIVERLTRIRRLLTHTMLLDFKGKCTIYIRGMMGVHRVEANLAVLERGPYAQYRNALHLRFLEKRKRHQRVAEFGYKPYILILEGWGHPEQDDPMVEIPGDAGSKVVVSRSRYLSCGPRYQSEFDAKIDAYIAARKPRVLADERTAESEER